MPVPAVQPVTAQPVAVLAPSPAPAAVVPPVEKIESPPASPPERPPGQRQPKRQPSAVIPPVAGKSVKTLVPMEQPSESQDILPNPRRKLVRSIDRQNPFVE
jgi:hypothetical protein